MIRAVVKPQGPDISIKLPESFIGKQVEVIAFTIDEPIVSDLGDPTLTHFASETILSKDWLSAEEDQAWQDL